MCKCKCGWTVRTSRALSVKCPRCSVIIECDGLPRPQAIVKRKLGKWVKYVRLLRKPSDTGIGDTVQRLAAAFGGERFKTWAKKIGLPCGCTERQADWNRRFPY